MDTRLHRHQAAQPDTRRAPLIAARVLAAVQGAIWFVLLIHGGLGIVFGVLAWLAASIGGRMSAIAAVLLLIPVVWLVGSWAPILSNEPQPRDWLIVASLVVPASLAAVLFLGRTWTSIMSAIPGGSSANKELDSP
jgi:hypothetical protein